VSLPNLSAYSIFFSISKFVITRYNVLNKHAIKNSLKKKTTFSLSLIPEYNINKSTTPTNKLFKAVITYVSDSAQKIDMRQTEKNDTSQAVYTLPNLKFNPYVIKVDATRSAKVPHHNI
jgi:hypothetical protein